MILIISFISFLWINLRLLLTVRFHSFIAITLIFNGHQLAAETRPFIHHRISSTLCSTAITTIIIINVSVSLGSDQSCSEPLSSQWLLTGQPVRRRWRRAAESDRWWRLTCAFISGDLRDSLPLHCQQKWNKMNEIQFRVPAGVWFSLFLCVASFK